MSTLILLRHGFHGVCSAPEAQELFLTRALSIAGGSA